MIILYYIDRHAHDKRGEKMDFLEYDGLLTGYIGLDRQVVVPEGIHTIDNEAFASVSYITSVKLPYGLCMINDYAFQDCEMLESINIPETVQERRKFLKAELSKYKDKLTHAGYYGVEESVKAVEKLLDIDINYYVKVNFSTVVKLVDAIGQIDENKINPLLFGCTDSSISQPFEPYCDKQVLIANTPVILTWKDIFIKYKI